MKGTRTFILTKGTRTFTNMKVRVPFRSAPPCLGYTKVVYSASVLRAMSGTRAPGAG
jgi:hypothetical protein